MAKGLRLFALSTVMSLIAPQHAFAASDTVPRMLDLGVGAFALVVACVLLLDVLALRRVATGAAIAEHVTHVMAAVVCLAASVIVRWFVRFSSDASIRSLAGLGADLLVIAAMVFFGLYFYLVRRAMMRFLSPTSAEETLARAQLSEQGPEGLHDEPPDESLEDAHG